MPAVLREDTPQTATTRKGRLRVALEAELQQRAASGQLRSIVIRAGDFFGCGSGTWLDQAIVKSLAKGKLVYPGPTDRVHAWTYLPDLAQAFVAAAAQSAEGPAFRCWHHRSHDATGAVLLDTIERLAHELGLAPAGPLKRGTLPWGVIRVGGWVVPIWRELVEMAYLWDVAHALDGRAMEAALGPLPHTPLDVALRATLRR